MQIMLNSWNSCTNLPTHPHTHPHMKKSQAQTHTRCIPLHTFLSHAASNREMHRFFVYLIWNVVLWKQWHEQAFKCAWDVENMSWQLLHNHASNHWTRVRNMILQKRVDSVALRKDCIYYTMMCFSSCLQSLQTSPFRLAPKFAPLPGMQSAVHPIRRFHSTSYEYHEDLAMAACQALQTARTSHW